MYIYVYLYILYVEVADVYSRKETKTNWTLRVCDPQTHTYLCTFIYVCIHIYINIYLYIYDIGCMSIALFMYIHIGT